MHPSCNGSPARMLILLLLCEDYHNALVCSWQLMRLCYELAFGEALLDRSKRSASRAARILACCSFAGSLAATVERLAVLSSFFSLSSASWTTRTCRDHWIRGFHAAAFSDEPSSMM